VILSCEAVRSVALHQGRPSNSMRGTFRSPFTFLARERGCLRGGAMIGTNVFKPEPLPSMWKVILFRIWQAEQRDRILSDWEDNVFGIHLSREEKQRLH
jgi:hypothetical protein